MRLSLNIPDEVNEIHIRKLEQQENPHHNIEEKEYWQCQLTDASPLDRKWNRRVTDTGKDIVTACNRAIQIWNS